MIKKILIIGDSYAVICASESESSISWSSMIARSYPCDILAQAGCSEFRIKKQLDNVNLNNYSHVIVSHTSSTRIPVDQNPLHQNSLTHKNADFIYNDVIHSDDHRVNSVKEYFEKYLCIDFYDYVWNLMVTDIYDRIAKSNRKGLHITFFDQSHPCIDISFYQLAKKYPGVINHMDAYANKQIFHLIENWINDD